MPATPTTYKVAIQTGHSSHFASVTVSSREATALDERIVVSPNVFSWMFESYGPNAVLPKADWWITRSCVEGAGTALADLGEAETQIVLEAFAVAAYQATFEHLTGARRFDEVDEKVLSEFAARLSTTGPS